MKKLQVFGVSLFIFVFSCSLASGIRINEVMPHSNNPLGDEWIELYNNENSTLMLSNWKISDKISNDTINLNIPAYGFGIIADSSIRCINFSIANESCIELTTIGSGLNDDEETIYLYDNSSNLIDHFSWNISIKNEGKSWQLYNGIWQSCLPTPGIENFCLQQNQTPNIYLELDYDRVVRNGEVFKVKIKAFNLLDKEYDVKVYIEDNETLLSEIYDDNEEEWKSGTDYVDSILSGSGNKSESLRLRMREKYGDFVGDAKVKAKIRISGIGRIIAEIENDIEIEKRATEDIIQDSESSSESNKENEQEVAGGGITGSVIKLNQPKDINISNNVYKSKIQYIKDYGIYGFALFCVFVIVILFIKNRKLR